MNDSVDYEENELQDFYDLEADIREIFEDGSEIKYSNLLLNVINRQQIHNEDSIYENFNFQDSYYLENNQMINDLNINFGTADISHSMRES